MDVTLPSDENVMDVPAPDAGFALLALDPDIMPGSQGIQRHPADVVAGAGILGARVAETDDKVHTRSKTEKICLKTKIEDRGSKIDCGPKVSRYLRSSILYPRLCL